VISAAVSDIFFRKIPNVINFTLLCCGLLVCFVDYGLNGLLSSLLAVAVTLGVLLVPFSLNVYRGGDVKLCLGMSAWVGIEKGLWIVGVGIIGGGLLGLLMLGFRRGARGRKMTVPMAVCFVMAGLWIQRYGIPM
jgi:prepilin peptidase CpaA